MRHQQQVLLLLQHPRACLACQHAVSVWEVPPCLRSEHPQSRHLKPTQTARRSSQPRSQPRSSKHSSPHSSKSSRRSSKRRPLLSLQAACQVWEAPACLACLHAQQSRQEASQACQHAQAQPAAPPHPAPAAVQLAQPKAAAAQQARPSSSSRSSQPPVHRAPPASHPVQRHHSQHGPLAVSGACHHEARHRPLLPAHARAALLAEALRPAVALAAARARRCRLGRQ